MHPQGRSRYDGLSSSGSGSGFRFGFFNFLSTMTFLGSSIIGSMIGYGSGTTTGLALGLGDAEALGLGCFTSDGLIASDGIDLRIGRTTCSVFL